MVSFLIRTERTNEKVRWPPSFAYTYMYMGILDVLRKKNALQIEFDKECEMYSSFASKNFSFFGARERRIDVSYAINCQSVDEKR